MKGSINFPCLDFDCPAIIKQVDGWNCGLACVVNAVAFVHHFQNKEFLLSGMTPANDKRDAIRYIVNQDEYNLCSFWEDLEKTLKKLHEEFVALVEDLHGLLSGTPSKNEVIEIKDTEETRIIDLTINFPANMTPQKKQEKKDSKEPDNNKENVENKEKDDTSQKNKSEDKDGTNVIWERKKKFFRRNKR